MDSILTWLIAAAVLGFFVLRYWRAHARKEAETRTALEQGQVFSDGPRAQHPHIAVDACIGCGACVAACPEGDVLALVSGKASIVHAHKCIGHGLCAEACPVGAITMVMGKPSAGSENPQLTAEYESSVPGLFVVGELGGLALIKNAVNQGRDCIDAIVPRLSGTLQQDTDILDVVIAGAGPAGISASLRATEHGLRAVTLERESVGGAVAKYPRLKLVMTSPVEFPLHGRFSKTTLSKEELLKFWDKIMSRADLNIRTGEPVETVQRQNNGIFVVRTPLTTYRARAVVLAVGRAGTPRRLGVPGEELPHILYRLIEVDQYTGKNILVVGGGDSAVEAALGLARQPGNRVTLSYRREGFTRLKDRNEKRIAEQITQGTIEVIFNSTPTEFRVGSVLLQTAEAVREIPNDLVWIFAGGTPPTEFLRACGITFGSHESSSATA